MVIVRLGVSGGRLAHDSVTQTVVDVLDGSHSVCDGFARTHVRTRLQSLSHASGTYPDDDSSVGIHVWTGHVCGEGGAWLADPKH